MTGETPQLRVSTPGGDHLLGEGQEYVIGRDASCDIVISKPGFGLVSECIVNNKPLIYSDRGDFAEYPYLVEGIEKYLRNVHIPSTQLYAGELRSVLEEIHSAPEPSEALESGGAGQIAEELIRSVGR